MLLIPNLAMAEILQCSGEEFSSYRVPQKNNIEGYVHVDIKNKKITLTRMIEVVVLNYDNSDKKHIKFKEDRDEFVIDDVSEMFIKFRKNKILNENEIIYSKGLPVKPLKDDYFDGYIDRVKLTVTIKNRYFKSQKNNYSKSFMLKCKIVKKEV